MENNKTVSVITVVYNGERYVESTIKSVLNQTYTNIEYIVIDGASSDSTVSIIKKYTDKITCWISESDKGIYDAMNKGITTAKGDWIIFMNAGDTFETATTLSDIFDYYNAFKNADIVFGDVRLINANENVLLKQHNKNIAFESICHQSQLIKLSTLKKHYYNTDFNIYADYEFQLKIFKNDRSKIVHIPLIVARYNTTGVSTQPFYKFYSQFKKVVDLNIDFPERYRFYLQGIKFSIKSILYSFMLFLKRFI